MDRQQNQLPIGEEYRNQRQTGHRHMNRKYVRNGFFDVVKDPASQPHGLHDGGEIIIQQNQAGRLAGHIRAAAAHGNTDVGGFQGRGVIDAIAGHGHNFAGGF
ncbi:MAG: hypothetical protein BWY71_02264 [Planctomycetes bacterium ADurb.Bin412]|nr:MAG: hypothetical protein BWY71_02264 [Planctomycetes bacterium ADurb.Bin412]